MPAYHQIQAYYSLGERSVPEVLAALEHALLPIVSEQRSLHEWLSSFRWSPGEDGFVYTQHLAISLPAFPTGITPSLQLLGWTPRAFAALRADWLQLDVLFPSAQLEEQHPWQDGKLQTEVVSPLLELLCVLTTTRPCMHVHLTDEVTDGLPWEAFISGRGQPWAFLAAAGLDETALPRGTESFEQRAFAGHTVVVNPKIVPVSALGTKEVNG